jgi:hypothetical protein
MPLTEDQMRRVAVDSKHSQSTASVRASNSFI